ncbi:MAG: hypothetical protein JNK72_19435 [Myxococcales bacterium]|nr:hypothetical protein [Myxococcales bacterium]
MKKTLSTLVVGLSVLASAYALGGCVVHSRPAPMYQAQPVVYGRPGYVRQGYARPAYAAPTTTTTTVYYR